MAARARTEHERVKTYERFKEEADSFFAFQLDNIGLSEAGIRAQNIPELEDSLDRIDDALRYPESFGMVRINLSSSSAIFILKSDVESIVQISVVPILLERKRLVIECLRFKRSQRPIQTLTDLIDSIDDWGLREKLRTEYEAAKSAATEVAQANVIKAGSAFIAMAMNPNNPMLEDVLDAIKEGARRSQITAERIDEAISNEPITPGFIWISLLFLGGSSRAKLLSVLDRPDDPDGLRRR